MTMASVVGWPGTMCPEVADEANPGVEPSPTGCVHVGGSEVLAALALRVSPFLSAVAVLRSSADRAPMAIRLRQVGRSESRTYHQSVSIEKSFIETLRLSLNRLRCPHRTAALECGRQECG